MVSKKTTKMICFIIFTCLIIFLAIFLIRHNNKNALEYKIVHYADENYINQDLEIHLSDFTSFNWDKIVVFRNPVSEKEIGETIGVEYKKSLDLLSGIIFVYKNNIVYEEMFKSNVGEVSPFIIYPHRNINEKPYFRVFTKEEALFYCEKTQYDDNYHYYRLYPKD